MFYIPLVIYHKVIVYIAKTKMAFNARSKLSAQREIVEVNRERNIWGNMGQDSRLDGGRVAFKETTISWTTAITVTPDQRLISVSPEWTYRLNEGVHNQEDNRKPGNRVSNITKIFVSCLLSCLMSYLLYVWWPIQPGPHNLIYLLLFVKLSKLHNQ